MKELKLSDYMRLAKACRIARKFEKFAETRHPNGYQYWKNLEKKMKRRAKAILTTKRKDNE